MMESEQNNTPTITVVTAPDFYMTGVNSRLLALGSEEFLKDLQSIVYKFWASEDIVLALSDRESQDMGWLAFHLATSDVYFLELSEKTDAWEMATLFNFPGEVYFVCTNPDLVVNSFLKLRHHRQVFNSVIEAVVAANSRHL